ncbi:MAG: HAMP domain-containing histidine kinase [Eubacterium sp.]|nr:HAMP domain-containing histidine kinase [Eubacterium sp.]
MKELSRKVFLTVFGILSFFLIVSLFIVNVSSYRREYDGVKRNLEMDIMEGPGRFKRPDQPDHDPDKEKGPDFDEIDNVWIMDYEVYVVHLYSDGTVLKIDNLGNEDSDFDVDSAIDDILQNSTRGTLKVENLYRGKYSYNYIRDNMVVIINDSNISEKIRKLLIESIGVFLLIELIILVISKMLTGWITRPAKEAFEKQREFIADASHELKTPLAVIMASSDEMMADESNKKYLENIKYESDRMNKLIAGLLDLSKLEEGVSKENYVDKNLSKIVEKTALVFEGVAFEEGVMIETDLEEDIIHKCSKEEIEKLVSILLDNAIKHSYKDSTIRVELKRKSGIILKITNKGDPIKEGDEEKIFERFYRADKSRSRSDNRYGLGLAIAKRIVLNHGGTIKAVSDREKSETIFRVEFK